MTRIAITQAAYDAICATLPLGSVGYENQVNERGERRPRIRRCGAAAPGGCATTERTSERS